MINYKKFAITLTCVCLSSCGKESDSIVEVETQDIAESSIGSSSSTNDAEAANKEENSKPQINTEGPTDSIEAAKVEAEAARVAAETAQAEAEAVKAAQVEAAKAAEAEAESAKAAVELAKSETEAAKAETVVAQAEAEAAKAETVVAQAEAEAAKAEAEAAKAETVVAQAEAEAAKAAKVELDAALADTTKYVYNGQIYNKRALDDTGDCDSSIECSDEELCLNDAGGEENQASSDDLFPHNGDANRPSQSLSGNEQCR